jgi:hypothetical protein
MAVARKYFKLKYLNLKYLGANRFVVLGGASSAEPGIHNPS